jgi:hypothetical protein
MVVSHAKKHDINDAGNHIKNDLDLNGNFSLLPDKTITLGRGSAYESQSFLKYSSTDSIFQFGRSLELFGNLYLGGEASIKGGVLSNDSLTLQPSRTAETPRFTFEGETDAGFIVNENANEEVYIKDNAYTTKTFFNFKHSNNTSITPHKFTIGNDINTTNIYLNGYIQSIITHELFSGDNTSDYLHIGTDGQITLYGNARQERELHHDAYNLKGNSATYNGTSCDATDTGVINNFYYAQLLTDSGGFGGNPEAFITNFTIPQDFDESTTEITIKIHYTSSATSGNAVVYTGIKPAGTNYSGTETYIKKTIPAPTTAYNRATYEYDFTGLSLSRGDEIGVVVYRDYDDASDTMSADAMVTGVSLVYVANQIGGTL